MVVESGPTKRGVRSNPLGHGGLMATPPFQVSTMTSSAVLTVEVLPVSCLRVGVNAVPNRSRRSACMGLYPIAQTTPTPVPTNAITSLLPLRHSQMRAYSA